MEDLEPLYQSAEAGNLEDLNTYCHTYLDRLIKQNDTNGEAEVAYTLPLPELPRRYSIEYDDRMVLRGETSVTDDIETLKGGLVERILSEMESDSECGLFGCAVSTVGGIKCEFVHVKPGGEVEVLAGPLDFKADQGAIEDALKHILKAAGDQ